MTVQLTIALLLVVFCAAYLVLQIWRFLHRRRGTGCDRCPRVHPADETGPQKLYRIVPQHNEEGER